VGERKGDQLILNILILAAVIGLLVKVVVVNLGAPNWVYYAVLPVLAVAFYLVNIWLIRRFISVRAPEFNSTDEVWPGVQTWELTAGLGIVPRWVSWIGFAAYASVLALLIPFVAGLFR
jgi:hypothetical protein